MVISIKDELTGELRDAIRTGDARRRDVIRAVETEVSMARTQPGFTGEVGDDLYRQVIAAFSKKMDKARAEYQGLGDRGTAMADKLVFEVDYLSRWLPAKLGEEETRALVRAAVVELAAAGPRQVGQVVGHLMRARGEELDGGLVNRIAREELGPTG
ncbi:MAG: GatB/YqeY domain-containing protein [Acidimicrobiia bacterium]